MGKPFYENPEIYDLYHPEKAREKIKKEGLNVDLIQSDFRELTSNIKGTYHCVMSTGNSLAHVNNTDVGKTIYQMSKLVKANGYINFMQV